MKKLFSIFMVMSLSLLLLAACAPSSTKTSVPSKNEEKVTITWWDPISVETSQESLREVIEGYEKEHPNVKIERTLIPFADIKNKILMGSAGNQLPDIVWIDNPDFQAFAAADILADLSKEVKEWKGADQYYDGPWSSTVYKGKNYGVPIYSNNLALYYNADMLKEANLKPPANWNELKEAAIKLTKPGVYGLAVAARKDETAVFQFLPFVWQAGSDLSKFDNKGTVDAISLWKDLVDGGYMSKEIITQSQGDINVQFASGKVAMMVNGTWQIPNLKKDAKVNWDVMPLPANQQSATVLGGFNWGITKASKHKDIAWDIIKFAEQPDRKKEILKIAGYLPSRKDLIQDPFWQDDKFMKVFVDSMGFAKARAYGPNYPKISVAVQDMIHSVLTGAKSPDDAVKEANAIIKPLLP